MTRFSGSGYAHSSMRTPHRAVKQGTYADRSMAVDHGEASVVPGAGRASLPASAWVMPGGQGIETAG